MNEVKKKVTAVVLTTAIGVTSVNYFDIEITFSLEEEKHLNSL